MKRSVHFFLLFFMALAAFADDWPQWRGPNRDGVSRERGIKSSWPPDGPPRLWEAMVGIGWSSMAVANGKVFTMGNLDEVDHVYCLDAKTGKEIWKHSYPCPSKDPNGFPGPRMTPVVDGERVYTLSREGHLYCLNVTAGTVIWSKEFQKEFGAKPPTWGWAGSPLIEGDLLIAEVGGPNSAMVAFEKRSGDVVWKTGDSIAGYASPIAYTQKGESFVLAFSAFGLESRRIRDGRIAWRHPWKTSYDVNAATPIVVGEQVFVSSAYGTGAAVIDFSQPRPAVVWQHKKMRIHMSGGVFWGGHLYGFDEAELKCIDFQTGEVKWGESKFGKGSLVVADGKLIVFGGSGQLGLVEANPKSYRELAFAQVMGGRDTWAPPVLSDGAIFCRSKETLIALDVRGGENSTETWIALFPDESDPKGWRVRDWSDVRRPGPEGAKWQVIDGVLHGSEPRGTWLMSEKDYGDFEIEFEWKLGARGNSGFGMRFPDYGDPAFDGLELQMVDPRYYPPNMIVPSSELTGSLYRGVAPSSQDFKPEAWNKYRVKAIGSKIEVELNGKEILNVNLSEYSTKLKRHNGEDADSLRERPRKGRIGFQELSREGGHVEIRNARIRVLD